MELLEINKNIVKDEKGASLVEYALLVALIAVVCLVAITALGTQANTTFNGINNSIGAANTASGLPN